MSAFDQLTGDVRSALNEENFDDVLRRSTRLLVNALELRVTVWEKKAKLAQEMDDALLLIKFDKENTNAYLRIGKLYAIQGKQQKAIDMLEKGLGTSPNIDQQKSIQQQIAISKSRLEHRFDLITKAPYEIICSIIGILDFNHDIKECMNVCRTWRTMILQCPELWETCIITRYGPWGNPSALHEMMPLITRYIKKMYIHYPCCFKFDSTYDFSHLQSLRLLYDSNEARNLSNSLLCALLDIGNSLKELEIQARYAIILLEDIIPSCPGLTYLSLYVSEIISYDIEQSHTTLLETIKFCTTIPSYAHNLEPFFRFSPHLRHIELYSTREVVDYEILSAISPYCPELISFKNHCDYVLTRIPYEVSINETTYGELQLLSLADIQSIIPLTQRLEKASETLRSILLFPPEGGRNSDLADWEPLSSTVMQNLTCISVSADLESALYRHLPTMLRSYPALESVYLNGECTIAAPETTDRIFDAVAELPYLRNLNLEDFRGTGEDLVRLIHHYATEPTLLKELSVANVDMNQDLLHEIARIESLRHLLIHIGDDQEYTGSSILEFTHLISQLPQLKILDIHGMALTKDAVENIGNSQSLERLELIDCGESFAEEVYPLIKHLV